MAFLETINFKITVENFPFDPQLNTDGTTLAEVEKQFQSLWCGGTVEATGCIVILYSFTNGSTVINGMVQQVADATAPIDVATKVKDLVDNAIGITALGNSSATAQETVGKLKVFECQEVHKG